MLKIILLVTIVILSFATTGYFAQNQSVAKQTAEALYSDYQDFVKKTKILNSSIASANIEEIKYNYMQSRFAYKKIEYLVTYIDKEYAERYFNGIPLYQPESNAPSASVLPPEGLQILEEELYSVQPNFEMLSSLSAKLTSSAKRFSLALKNAHLYDRHIFEAIRLGLIRILSLGMTGFDSPNSVKAIEENYISFRSIAKVWNLYAVQNPNVAVISETKKLFEEAASYISKNQDFDSFNRTYFTREYISPLFSNVYDAQIALNIEFHDEVSNLKQAVNFRAKEIFSTEFLNKYYYMNLSKRNDTKELKILGKTLFFDPILSSNNKRACSSCHDPKLAFTDGEAKSKSFNYEGTVERNSPTLVNAVYSDKFFYDLRAQKLEDQVDHVITSSKEFDTEYEKIIFKLENSPDYKAMFEKAYPYIQLPKVINKYTISTALASYVASLTSMNSDFDRYMRKETNHIDSSVIRGYNLFAGKALCGTCHFTPTFNGTVPPYFIETDSENIGVTANSDLKNPGLDADMGRAEGLLKDRLEIFRHSFKTITLRNIELTAPYMHNGAFKTLEEVLEFYNEGGAVGLGLDNPQQTLPEDKLNLTQQEKKDIIAFLKSLTDNIYVELPKLPEYLNTKRVAGGEY